MYLPQRPKNLGEILEDVRMVGKMTKKEEEAYKLVTQMESRIKAVIDKTEGLERKPRVFYIALHEPIWSIGSGTFSNDLIEKAGGKNIFQDVTGSKTIDIEMIAERNPEVIIARSGSFEWAKEEPRLAVTEAGRNDRVYPIRVELVGRPGPSIVDALEWFAYFVHPEIFSKPEGD